MAARRRPCRSTTYCAIASRATSCIDRPSCAALARSASVSASVKRRFMAMDGMVPLRYRWPCLWLRASRQTSWCAHRWTIHCGWPSRVDSSARPASTGSPARIAAAITSPRSHPTVSLGCTRSTRRSKCAGAGACVYAAYSGTIVGKKQGSLVIDHQGTGEAYASQYLHIAPGPKEVGDRVIKGEPIASVRPHPAGDHLHFELWHWITRNPQGDTDTEAVPVDPTRLLYHWEQAVDLDYAVLGSVDAAAGAAARRRGRGSYAHLSVRRCRDRLTRVAPDLGAGSRVRLAHQRSGHRPPAARRARCDHRDRGSVRPSTITPSSIDRLGLTRRWSYPTILVEADGLTYGVPLHQAPDADRTLSTCSGPPSTLAAASSWRSADRRSGGWMGRWTRSRGSSQESVSGDRGPGATLLILAVALRAQSAP